MTVFVLWEDKATGSIESFGPHAFLIACVASRLVVPARRGTRSCTARRQTKI